MKKILAVLSIMVILIVAAPITSANSSVVDDVGLVATVPMDGDIGIVKMYFELFQPELSFDGEKVINTSDIASVEGLTESVPIVNVVLINGIVNDNLVASVEDLTEIVPNVNVILNDKLVSNDNVASVEGLIKVFSLSADNSNGTDFAETLLPVEVGLSKSNIFYT